MVLRWMGLLVLGLSTACGGHTVGGGGGDPEPAEGTDGTDDSKAQGSVYPTGEGDTELGECKLGHPDDYTRPCPWVVPAPRRTQGPEDELCYDTREMACNCACPRNHDSQCLSGFDAGDYGRVLVTCQ